MLSAATPPIWFILTDCDWLNVIVQRRPVLWTQHRTSLLRRRPR